MGTQLPLPKRGHSPSIFGPCLLWPNGCMDQDATWYGGKPRPRPHCATWGPSSSSPRKGHSPSIFGPCLLWPNGWMDQDATWYDGRPQPGQYYVRCGQNYTPSGTAPTQVSAHVCCNQTAGWIKMPLGTKVSLGPDRIVLHGNPAPPSQKGHSPQFSAMSSVTKRSPISATAEHLLSV